MSSFKKITTLIAIVIIIAFWQILGTSSNLKDESNSVEQVACLSYAPYAKDESPFLFDKGMVLKEENIKKDLETLRKYTSCIRTYSTVGQELVFKVANELNMQIHAGVWIGKEHKQAKNEIRVLKNLATLYPNTIKSIIVGNEVLLRRDTTKQNLINYIIEVKEALPQYRVTYADVWEFWLENKDLKDYVDFITIHILPYWEDEPQSIDNAINHLKNVRLNVEKELNSSDILIGETGWPSAGRAREGAYPSNINQAKFIRDFINLAYEQRWDYNIIEAIDQPWKRANEGAVGGYWGIFDKDRADKNIINGEISNFPNYMFLTFLNLTLFIFVAYRFINKKCSNSDFILLSTLNIVFSTLFIMQINQYISITRDIYEFLWAILILGFALFTYIFIIHQKSLNNSNKIIPKTVFHFFISILFIISAKLAFNGRYENFEIFVLTIFLISFLFNYYNKFERLNFGIFEKLISILLLANTILIFIQEGVENIFSLSLIIINLLVVTLLFITSKVSSKELKKPLLYIAFFTLFALLIKYFILYNQSLGEFCQLNDSNFICKSIGYTWYLLYFNYLGAIALALALIYSIFSFRVLLFLALFISILSLTLTNIFLGSIAFLILLYKTSKVKYGR